MGLCPQWNVVVDKDIRMGDPLPTEASLIAADGNEYIRGEDRFAVVVETCANDTLNFEGCEGEVA